MLFGVKALADPRAREMRYARFAKVASPSRRA
jgi:hypothetical protein